MEILGVSGVKSSLLATICLILKEMAKGDNDIAENMARVILTALEMEKELND